MKNIYITGSSGFVGENVTAYFRSKYSFHKYNKENVFDIEDEVVLHFAGKAHDLLNAFDFKDYYFVNTELTKNIFDCFLQSKSKIFIYLSSVKAVAEYVDSELTENTIPNPITHYGKSKLLAEQYILSKVIPDGKRVYILRPCMIHGRGNKGNLNYLYKIVSKRFPWPLGAFENKRSFCSIDNLCFIIHELIENALIPSGVYNIADDDPLSTNELIQLISESQGKRSLVWKTPKLLIYILSKFGDLLRLPLNTERLNKLTETYIVSNKKILQAINKSLPVTSKEGLIKTFNSFNKNA